MQPYPKHVSWENLHKQKINKKVMEFCMTFSSLTVKLLLARPIWTALYTDAYEYIEEHTDSCIAQNKA
jgi:hypothetical protein